MLQVVIGNVLWVSDDFIEMQAGETEKDLKKGWMSIFREMH